MCLGEKNKLLCYYPFVLTFVSTQEQVEKLKNENKSHRKKNREDSVTFFASILEVVQPLLSSQGYNLRIFGLVQPSHLYR